MFESFTSLLGVCTIAFAGFIVGVAILADLIAAAFTSWEPMEVDRGEIVDPDRGAQ